MSRASTFNSCRDLLLTIWLAWALICFATRWRARIDATARSDQAGVASHPWPSFRIGFTTRRSFRRCPSVSAGIAEEAADGPHSTQEGFAGGWALRGGA